MKALLVLALAVVATALPEAVYQEEFTNWMLQYEKSYSPEELFKRFSIWKDTYDLIRFHNAGNTSFEMGLNQFSDLTSAEFKAIYLGYRGQRTEPVMTLKEVSVSTKVGAYPSGSLDWSQKGAVTGVKNQGQCGSCWAFSTTGSVEGTVALMAGHLTSLSEQQLVDCAGAYGNAGCNGGLMDNAFKYVEKNGLCTESAYSYTGRDGTCKSTSCTMSTDSKIVSYKDVTHTENALGAAVDITPISVAIEADQAAFQNYKSGVLTGTCGKNLDHGVLLVGYGHDTSSNLDYWKVKNSWGTSWGEKGYVRIVRNQDKCGIADEPSYAIDK
jgi:C1A family cysteine protease